MNQYGDISTVILAIKGIFAVLGYSDSRSRYYAYFMSDLSEADIALHIGCISGDIQLVHLALKAGADVNRSECIYQLDDMNSFFVSIPLEHAVRSKKIDLITLLISSGADVNNLSVLRNSMSLVFLEQDLYDSEDLNIAKLLHDAGADLNFELGCTHRDNLLYHLYVTIDDACENAEICKNWLTPLQFLISMGVNVNHFDAYGRTPMMFALLMSSHKYALLLFDMGADPWIRNGKLENIFTYISEENFDKIAPALFQTICTKSKPKRKIRYYLWIFYRFIVLLFSWRLERYVLVREWKYFLIRQRFKREQKSYSKPCASIDECLKI